MSTTPMIDGRSRWVRHRGALLVGSLALNLFLAGWIVGGVTRPSPPLPFAMAERMAGRLTPGGFARVADDMRAMDAEVGRFGDRFDPARQAVIAAVSGSGFDAGQIRAALGALSQARNAQDERMTDRLVAVLGKLDEDDRRAFVGTLFGSPPPPPPR